MDVRPLRLGIIGCGAVGRGRHLPVLDQLPEIEVFAIADRERKAVAEAASRFGIPHCFTDAEELMGLADLEAVAICTPPSSHVPLAMAALRAGKHLFVEKPLAVSLDEADALLTAAEQSSRVAMMGFNLRFHRLLRRARNLASRGDLGCVHCVSSTFCDPLVRQSLSEWRSHRDQGGGAIFDRAVHHFDLWRFLLGEEVQEVFAMGRSRHRDDDAAVITARLSGGAIANLVVLDDTVVRHDVMLFGTEGAARVDVLRFDGFDRPTLREFPGAPSTRLRRLGRLLADPVGDLGAIRRGGDFDATYELEWRHFADVVRRGGEPKATLADGKAALEIAVAVSKSLRDGCAVKLTSADTIA